MTAECRQDDSQWHVSKLEGEEGEEADLDKASGAHGCKQIRKQWGHLFWLCPAVDELIEQGLEDKPLILVYQSDLHRLDQGWTGVKTQADDRAMPGDQAF